MKANGQKCLNCGQPLSKKQIWRNRKYCSRKCFADGYWGKPIELGKSNTRSKKLIEVAELCSSGLTPKEASKETGISLLTIHSWFAQYGAENIVQDKKCAVCGKSMVGLPQISKRIYCSNECKMQAAYLRKHPVPSRMKFDPELRKKGLEMYWGGAEGYVISKQLGVCEGTVYAWIHYFGHLKERTLNPELIKLFPINLRLRNAKTSMEWKSILSENAPCGEAKNVILVCGHYNALGEINNLASIVADKLKNNPCDGSIYAFCSLLGNQVSTVCFKNGTYIFTKRPKCKGRYIWPDESIGNEIAIRENEFDYLLTLSKRRANKRYFLDKSPKI
jgi:endogenous inhibitor of DNA gyrase (YacG/DUF329 family)